MKIAIVGGGNVYALNFARHLDKIGVDHFGIGRSGPKESAFWQINHHYRYHKLHLVAMLQAILAVLDTERPDVIVNFAAQGEGAASFAENAHYFYETNTLSLVRFAEECRRREFIKRFVQISSSEVYGSVDKVAKETDLLNPTSPYSVSKAAFDQHLMILSRLGLMNGVNIIRPTNAYCPGQQPHRIIPMAIIAALSGRKLKLHGGGQAEKSYMHADDLSQAIMTVLTLGEAGRVYNVGPDEPIKIRYLVAKVAEACGVAFDDLVENAGERVGQDARYWLDTSAIKLLGWRTETSLTKGVAGMVEWVTAHPELLAMDTTFRIRP